ncbi:hypothetical protein CR513_60913, partial [Mucuna pruriens]
KFDEPWPTWKKVRLQVDDMWFKEFKGSRILKNAMNKIRNGHDHANWIPANISRTRALLPRKIELLIREP